MTKFSEVAHLYLGCDLISKATCERVAVLEGVAFGEFHFRVSGVRYSGPIAMYKPILRLLSSMTEDELIEIIQITAPDSLKEKPTAEDYYLDIFYNDGGNAVDGDVAIGADYTCICYDGQIVVRQDGSVHFFGEDGATELVNNMPKIYTYLLSKHFDLFGLIESGEAIEAGKQ
jgi:hypothetical protein